MSLISSIQNSRGRFKKKRRSNKAHDARKQKSAKKAVVTAKQKHIEDANKRQRSGNGEGLLRMKRLREERELEQGHDEENRGTAEVGGVVAQRVQVGHLQELSVEPGEEASSVGEAPCAVEEKVDGPSNEDDGFFSDLFKSVMAEEVSPTVALAASLPDIPAQELLDEAEEIKTLLRRRGGIQR